MKSKPTSNGENHLTAEQLRQIIATHWSANQFAVHFEAGLNKGGALRADLIATNTRPTIIICEVKSSPSDFRGDHKWHKYLPYCTQFYWVMSSRTYARVSEEIPKGTGVFVIDNETRAIQLIGRSSKRVVEADKIISVLSRMSYKTADKKRSTRVSEDAPVHVIGDAVGRAVWDKDFYSYDEFVCDIKLAIRPYV